MGEAVAKPKKRNLSTEADRLAADYVLALNMAGKAGRLEVVMVALRKGAVRAILPALVYKKIVDLTLASNPRVKTFKTANQWLQDCIEEVAR